MNLALNLLGPFHVSLDGQCAQFATDRARALLVYLAVEADRPQRREALADLLWPDRSEATARQNLSQDLARLRRAIHDHAADPPFLHITPTTVQFIAGADAVDVTRFQALLAACDAHPHQNLIGCCECMARLRQAIALYRGDFMQGFTLKDNQPFNEWLLLQQERLHHLAMDGLETLVHHATAIFDFAQVRGYAELLVALEPWNEEGHRQLMRALDAGGQRSAALAQFEICSRILATELGVEPSPETIALYERIRAGESGPSLSTPTAHRLPTPLTPFIGRERELAEIIAQLADPNVRLLTLVGAGGMGKTRLALEAAQQIAAALPNAGCPSAVPDRGHLTPLGSPGRGTPNPPPFEDGVCFVSLAPLTTPAAIAPAIAAALGLPLQGDPQQTVLHALATRRLLLILDNFEHVLAGVGLVVDLLQAAPGVRVLVTSRARLGVPGAQSYTVEGMDYPSQATLTEATASSAVRLFVQSARRGRSNFRLDASNVDDVLAICRLTAGMPLGLELAAAWVELLTLAEIAAEIERSIDFLAYQLPALPDRQRSLRAVFDWSWRLLSEAEQKTLCQLSVFRGGFTRDAAQTVVGATLGVLTRLVFKSLLGWHWGQGGGRYDMHELLRQFAAEHRAVVPAEAATVDARHGDYYLTFVAQRERRLARHEPREAAAEIGREIDNVRQAWTWASQHLYLDGLDQAAYCLWLYYRFVGLTSEAEHRIALATEAIQTGLARGLPCGVAAPVGQRVLSRMLAMYGAILIERGQNESALRVAELAICLGQIWASPDGEALGALVKGQALRRTDQSSLARVQLEHTARLAHAYQRRDSLSELLPDVEYIAYGWLCSIALSMDDYAAADHYVAARLGVCRSRGNRLGEWFCITDWMDIATARQDYPTARRHCEDALCLAQQIGYRHGEAISLYRLAELAQWQGQYSLAYCLTEQAQTLYQASGALFGVAYTSRTLGHLNLVLGHYPLAQRWLEHHFQVSRAVEMPLSELVPSFLHLAVLAQATGQPEQALAYAEEAWHIGRQADSRLAQGRALTILGHMQAYRGLSAARTTYARALAAFEALGTAHLAAEPRAGLAALALADGDTSLALTYVEAILPVLAHPPRIGLDEPFYTYLACYSVLAAAHDSRAASVLTAAHAILMDYARHIEDETLRHSFLEHVAVHHQLHQAYICHVSAHDTRQAA